MQRLSTTIHRRKREDVGWSVIVPEQPPEEVFTYTPLADSTRQIRLLQFLPRCNDNKIVLQQTTWDKDNQPEYNAISYTWGDSKDSVPVVVNGGVLEVRRNCAYALWQAWLHNPSAFVWIDSICIHQLHRTEKSHQVAMMGDIYSQAKLVLICVGEPENDSVFFMQNMQRLHGRLTSPDDLRRGYDDPVRRWALARTRYYWRRLEKAYIQFCDRPYWKRLWIVQEVACAKTGIILCGEEQLLWSALVAMKSNQCRIRDYSESQFPPPLKDDQHRIFQCLEAQNIGIQDVFHCLAGSICSDPRDRLYGALQLIDWERTPLDEIMPDYELSVYDLAVQVLPHIGFWETAGVVDAFEMACGDEWIARYGKSRGGCGHRETLATSSPINSGATAGLHYFRLTYENTRFSRISIDDIGRLTTTFERNAADSHNQLHVGLDELKVLKNMEWEPQTIYAGNSVALFACTATRSGDVLASSAATSRVHLVIRKRPDGSFGVIGQAVSVGDYGPGSSAADVIVELAMQDEERLFFFAQDKKQSGPCTDSLIEGGVSWAFDVYARLERLNTSVTTFSWPDAARIKASLERNARENHFKQLNKALGWPDLERLSDASTLHEEEDPLEDQYLATGPCTLRRRNAKRIIRRDQLTSPAREESALYRRLRRAIKVPGAFEMRRWRDVVEWGKAACRSKFASGWERNAPGNDSCIVNDTQQLPGPEFADDRLRQSVDDNSPQFVDGRSTQPRPSHGTERDELFDEALWLQVR